MAIRTRDEILSSVTARFGEDTSDETLALIEDITDTLTDLENKNNSEENWEQRYRENDAAWRKKYRDRFFSGDSGDDTDEPEQAKPNNYSYENLFKEG